MRHKARPGQCRIGTSGWSYSDWKGVFYPDELAEQDFLSFYAEQFPTVELNNSFYHLPNVQTVKHWSETAPKGFIFSVKSSRFITHMKKLKVDTRFALKVAAMGGFGNLIRGIIVIAPDARPVVAEIVPCTMPEPGDRRGIGNGARGRKSAGCDAGSRERLVGGQHQCRSTDGGNPRQIHSVRHGTHRSLAGGQPSNAA